MSEQRAVYVHGGPESVPLNPRDSCDWSFILWLRQRHREKVCLFPDVEMVAYRAGFAAGLRHAYHSEAT